MSHTMQSPTSTVIGPSSFNDNAAASSPSCSGVWCALCCKHSEQHSQWQCKIDSDMVQPTLESLLVELEEATRWQEGEKVRRTKKKERPVVNTLLHVIFALLFPVIMPAVRLITISCFQSTGHLVCLYVLLLFNFWTIKKYIYFFKVYYAEV